PVGNRRLAALRREPGNILESGLRHRLAAEEARAREDAMLAPEADEIAHEVAQPLILRADTLPIGPGQLVVLAIGVIVAALRAADLVAGEEHRHAQRQEQRGDEVALLLVAQRDHLGVVGRALAAAIPAEIGIVAVAVAFVVRLVVLVVVADEVAQREPVMGGDEVDAGPGPPPVVAEDVGGAGEAGGEIGGEALIALPEAPNGVAVLRIPLGPARRKI